MTKLPLFARELPSRGYDTRSLQSVDYGGNPIPEGNGWSALDLGRMLAALYNLKTCHPEYTAAVDKIVLDWSYLHVVREGILSSATVTKEEDGRSLTRVNPETRLGYEEYASRAFQLWGFNVERSAVGGEYQTASVEGVKVPLQRRRTDTKSKNQYTVSNPFLLYALEFGLDPKMRSLFEPIFQAQAERYRRTSILTASATTLIDRKPYTFILWLPPNHQSISERLITEKKALEKTIRKKELELLELSRFRYIARPKTPGIAHHAKAGNINYAIFSGETAGNFIVTLDGDHIPKPNFIKRVLPYFYTYNLLTGQYDQNQIAFVQTRQDFYNIPPGDPFGHRANLFYGPLQQGKDGMNAAFYTGTNAILRREALVSVGLQNFADEFAKDEKRLDEFNLVGGVSSNSITEDMNTAMRLHSAGWKSIYHNELLAEGLAPDDLSSTLKQRLRWAQGTIQVLVRENPLTKSGLTFWQRLQYFKTMYSYFSGFATLVFISCPIIYFFTDIVPVKTYGPDFAIHFFPAFIINRLTFLAVIWGIPASEVWRSEQYAIALFPLLIQAVWSVFTGQKINFQVTPKQRQSGIYLRLVWPQLAVFILTILGMLWSLYRFAIGHLNYPEVHLLNCAWAIYCRRLSTQLFGNLQKRFKSDFEPKFFVDITSVVEEKVAAIGCYESESNKVFMQLDAILVVSRFWARELGQKDGYFEAFEISRQCVDASFFTAIANSH